MPSQGNPDEEDNVSPKNLQQCSSPASSNECESGNDGRPVGANEAGDPRSRTNSGPRQHEQQQPPAAATEPLACVSCRARKLKCDKAPGICGRCAKVGQECVYPESRRRPTFKKRNVRELEARLGMLVRAHLLVNLELSQLALLFLYSVLSSSSIILTSTCPLMCLCPFSSLSEHFWETGKKKKKKEKQKKEINTILISTRANQILKSLAQVEDLLKEAAKSRTGGATGGRNSDEKSTDSGHDINLEYDDVEGTHNDPIHNVNGEPEAGCQGPGLSQTFGGGNGPALGCEAPQPMPFDLISVGMFESLPPQQVMEDLSDTPHSPFSRLRPCHLDRCRLTLFYPDIANACDQTQILLPAPTQPHAHHPPGFIPPQLLLGPPPQAANVPSVCALGNRLQRPRTLPHLSRRLLPARATLRRGRRAQGPRRVFHHAPARAGMGAHLDRRGPVHVLHARGNVDCKVHQARPGPGPSPPGRARVGRDSPDPRATQELGRARGAQAHLLGRFLHRLARRHRHGLAGPARLDRDRHPSACIRGGLQPGKGAGLMPFDRCLHR